MKLVEDMKAAQQTKHCPGCQQPCNFEHLGEKGLVRLLRCPQCRLVFADRDVWREPYQEKDYYDPGHQPEEEYPLRPAATDFDRVNTILRHAQPGRFLDFGGGLGRTGIAATERGFEVTLIEDSERAVVNGRQHHHRIHWVKARDLPAEMKEGSFDVAGMFHVLEHIPNPGELLGHLHRALKPGGILVIEVPNWGSHLRRIQGVNWEYVLDHHVNYFDRKSLVRTVEPAGFRFKAVEYRRTFAINERQPWREHIKKVLCILGFAQILRCVFVRR